MLKGILRHPCRLEALSVTSQCGLHLAWDDRKRVPFGLSYTKAASS